MGDITYIPTWEGWAYLATVIDLASRRVVGWPLADHMRTELVTDALTAAFAQRRPPAGLVFHSDRGCQRAIYLLWQRREIADGYHEYDPDRHVVTFVVRVRYGISEVIVRRLAADALRQSLQLTGFAIPHGWHTAQPHAWLRFTPWPQGFWWR